MAKTFLWEALVTGGVFPDRKKASAWIMTGKVFVDAQRVDKPGYSVPKGATITVKDVKKYVSKGGLKLEGALADFGIKMAGKVALDSGASTGGFTDCLIKQGAQLVYAVDVGYGQLAGQLRVDERVVNMERTNLGDVSLDQLHPRPEVITLDLSYLSLKKAIPMAARLVTASSGQIVCLVKPLFEVEDSTARRSGTIDDPLLYRNVLLDLADFVAAEGLGLKGVAHSHVTGNSGTREFFLCVGVDGKAASFNVANQADAAIAAALSLDPYNEEENQVKLVVGV